MGTKLVKSSRDKKIMGVCGGIAEYLHIDSTLVRIIWAVAVCCFGSGVLLYIIAALIMPEGPVSRYNDYNNNYNNNYNNGYYNTNYYSPTDNNNYSGSYNENTYEANYNSSNNRYEVYNNNPNNR